MDYFVDYRPKYVRERGYFRAYNANGTVSDGATTSRDYALAMGRLIMDSHKNPPKELCLDRAKEARHKNKQLSFQFGAPPWFRRYNNGVVCIPPGKTYEENIQQTYDMLIHRIPPEKWIPIETYGIPRHKTFPMGTEDEYSKPIRG